MRSRTLLTGAALGAALLAGGVAAPARAAPAASPAEVPAAAPDRGPALVLAGWTTALRAGDPVRECPSSACRVLWRTAQSGQQLHWYHREHNSAGNLWYALDSPRHGWIFCGNVAAPC
ncbi:hypothetical protein [Streptomyces sp. CAU 1734]|uniref:hypothetical protein n=1 Tax=Streptomyces sp. CAU 1734 TaxID=3140360 RepID=UPI0032609FFF